MPGQGEWGTGNRPPRVSKRLRLAVGTAITFVLLTGATALIGKVTTDTTDRLTAHDSRDAAKVTVARTHSGPSRLSVKAASSERASADGYIFERSLNELSKPPNITEPSCEPWRAWAKRSGGIDAGGTIVELYVMGSGSGTVILDHAEAEIVERGPPIRGVYAYCPIQFSRIHPRLLVIDLDEPRPSVEYTVTRDYYEPPRRRPFRFSLRPGEVEDFEVAAASTNSYSAWRLHLSYLAEGERHEAIVSDKNGAPFRTSPTTNAVTVGFVDGEGWVPSPLRSGD